ncbi:hypothetical protein QBC39DRAFT_162012 [Podospora conica]|nr:hypothetical protein QBC39DRAFT_162012 [Schizothecium conicum]
MGCPWSSCCNSCFPPESGGDTTHYQPRPPSQQNPQQQPIKKQSQKKPGSNVNLGPNPSPQNPKESRNSGIKSEAESETQREIRDRLVQCVDKTPGYYLRTNFITIDQIVDILSIENVVDLLPICAPGTPPSDYHRLARKICGAPEKRGLEMGDKNAFDRILAILLFMDQGKRLMDFVERGINNAQLPIKKKAPLMDGAQGWGLPEWHTFRQNQWKVMAPVLGPEDLPPEERRYEFQDDRPLPFIKIPKKDQQKKMEGGFGIVEAVTIPEAHNRFVKYSKFAVKSLRSNHKDEFDHEVSNLNRFIDHPHIVQLLFTVESVSVYPATETEAETEAETKEVKYLLVFPLAAGTLKEVWTTETWKTHDMETLAEWTLKQCLGLAKALWAVHGSDSDKKADDSDEAEFGIHSDIKPENILWFKSESSSDLGTMQLADFGITTFHHKDSRSNTISWANTKTYAPPEDELTNTKSRAFDIWSLGCVFLEWLSFLVLGVEKLAPPSPPPSNEPSLTVFAAARLAEAKRLRAGRISGDTFFTVENLVDNGAEKRVARVNAAVVKRMQVISGHARYTHFIHDLLTLVQKGMLVINAKEDPGGDGRNLRYRVDRVREELEKMDKRRRGKNSKAYFTAKYTPDQKEIGGHEARSRPDEVTPQQGRRLHTQSSSSSKHHSTSGKPRLYTVTETASGYALELYRDGHGLQTGSAPQPSASRPLPEADSETAGGQGSLSPGPQQEPADTRALGNLSGSSEAANETPQKPANRPLGQQPQYQPEPTPQTTRSNSSPIPPTPANGLSAPQVAPSTLRPEDSSAEPRNLSPAAPSPRGRAPSSLTPEEIRRRDERRARTKLKAQSNLQKAGLAPQTPGIARTEGTVSTVKTASTEATGSSHQVPTRSAPLGTPGGQSQSGRVRGMTEKERAEAREKMKERKARLAALEANFNNLEKTRGNGGRTRDGEGAGRERGGRGGDGGASLRSPEECLGKRSGSGQ